MSESTSYQSTPLYGGAITASLPAHLVNAARFRPVPDNQEVFVESRDGAPAISVIFELLERAPQADGLDALVYHIDDVRDEGDRARVLDRRLERLGEMTNIPAFSAVATFVRTTGQRRIPEADFHVVIALLARLEKQESDVLILIQIPHKNDDVQEPDLKLSSPTSKMRIGLDIAAQISRTLEVKDWGIFGE